MNIFNSLGSNYDLTDAVRILFSFGGTGTQKRLEKYLEQRYGGKAILSYKGRDVLTLALNALPEKGRIAFNGYTCLAVYESMVESGHVPLYLDIAENALDFSQETLRSALEQHKDIKAVIVQNTLGFPYDIVAIEKLCREHDIPLIEDLAHSIGARYADGREAGTVGDFVIFSFSQDKVIDAVSGGALVLRNQNYHVEAPREGVSFGQQLKDRLYPSLTWKIRMAYAFGIGRPYHALVRMTGILSSPFGKKYGPRILPGWYCANILSGYTMLEKVAARRRAIARIYADEINGRVRMRVSTNDAANLRFPLVVEGRDRLIEELRNAGVHVSDTWYDAPVAPKKYMHRAAYAGECPHSENMSAHMLNLPTHANVSERDARSIARLVNNWLHADANTEYTPALVTERDEWEAFMRKRQPHSFLHSWLWGEHAEATGSKIYRIGIYKGDELVAAALLIKVSARRGAFLLCPHGPVIAENEAEILRLLARECTRIATAEKCDFIRFCPLAKDSFEERARYRALGFRDAPIHMHPELSWMLDVTKSEDDLLRDMRKTTRYLIKKMEKEGVEVEMSTNPDDIEKFWPVYEATVQRQQFTPFKKTDLRKEFELFAKNANAAFFFGNQHGIIVAAAIIVFYNGQAFYHHSGSLSSGSNVSYLLQWRVIQEAKRRGCTLYNFWGISPVDKPNHPWAGLSLFKKGFGGFAEEYLHAQDKPLTAKYGLNYVVETSRRIRRGL